MKHWEAERTHVHFTRDGGEVCVIGIANRDCGCWAFLGSPVADGEPEGEDGLFLGSHPCPSHLTETQRAAIALDVIDPPARKLLVYWAIVLEREIRRGKPRKPGRARKKIRDLLAWQPPLAPAYMGGGR